MKLLQFIPLALSFTSSALAQFGGGFGGGFPGFGGGFPGFGGGDMGGFGGGAGGDPGITVSENAIKIMPVGDSITFGIGENGGYRKYLYDNLTKKGYEIDMVGPEGSNGATANNIRYDDNHAGYSGYTIKEGLDFFRGQAGGGSLYNVLKQKDAIKKAQPDIILLIIGTNDMSGNHSIDACTRDLHSLLDYMIADMPAHCMIFIGSIPDLNGNNTPKVVNYNNAVKKVASEYESNGKNVRFADIHGCLNGMADMGTDQVHPNGTGYRKMGNFWADVVDKYLKEKPKQEEPKQNPGSGSGSGSNTGNCSSKITSQGYKCCSANCVVQYTDADGDWGVENNQWCGCGNGKGSSNVCVGAQGFPCCKTTKKVEYVDGDGNWGVENGNWCLIK